MNGTVGITADFGTWAHFVSFCNLWWNKLLNSFFVLFFFFFLLKLKSHLSHLELCCYLLIYIFEWIIVVCHIECRRGLFKSVYEYYCMAILFSNKWGVLWKTNQTAQDLWTFLQTELNKWCIKESHQTKNQRVCENVTTCALVNNH